MPLVWVPPISTIQVISQTVQELSLRPAKQPPPPWELFWFFFSQCSDWVDFLKTLFTWLMTIITLYSTLPPLVYLLMICYSGDIPDKECPASEGQAFCHTIGTHNNSYQLQGSFTTLLVFYCECSV